ncbi:Transcription elongation factor 1-like protein [Dichanthelium oligosanthes]|uniref:Transcription elongation factor 1 homolog n=1 Tax=Dichanthelium oligosanthes TaxID=888268 RepID=A0A1E5UJL5_9POAL|nr:Transcription elongation factor 1-like protein [Dichanthelium oligosanthes]
MGKRKSRTSKPAPRKPQKLVTEFTCPFCNHPGTVECRIDVKYKFAEASCRICQETYATSANPLTEPVDVYSEWIDACELVNEGVVVRRCKPRLGDDGDYEADIDPSAAWVPAAMGKRKSRTSKPAPRKPPKLDTEFTCPFCNHPGTVECRIDHKDKLAEASCRICLESYGTSANPLTEALDVYSEWIDACVEANEGVVVRRCKPRLGDARGYEADV